MSVTLSAKELNGIVQAAVAKAMAKHGEAVKPPVKHHHRVVEEVWTSESESSDETSEEKVKTKKMTKKVVADVTAADDGGWWLHNHRVVKKAPKGKKKVVDMTADGHVMKKVDESDIACYCPTRHGDECEATVRYRIKGGEFPYVCAAHAKILREGGHIGPKPKKERDMCRATTKKGHTCKNYASEDSYYCHLHDEDDE
jgi:hypothetical protein